MLDGRLDPALCLLLTRQDAPAPAASAPLWLPLIRFLSRRTAWGRA